MSKELGKLFAQVWEDKQLQARLKADPKAVLEEYGVQVPPGLDLEVLECTQDITYIMLPPQGKAGKVPPLEKLPESYGLGAVYQVVITKAEKDAAFRKLALSDPMAALARIGVNLPAGHTVKIVEATSTKSFLIIPPAPQAGLSSEELDKVAGGVGPVPNSGHGEPSGGNSPVEAFDPASAMGIIVAFAPATSL